MNAANNKMATIIRKMSRAPGGATKRRVAYPHRVSNPYAPPSTDDDSPPTAGYGVRVAARLLDGLIGMTVAFAYYFVAERYDLPPGGVFVLIVPIVLWRALSGQSPGDRLCGIKRVTADGRRRWIVVR
jgi:uncharacterized RDD family membrane protein YckC